MARAYSDDLRRKLLGAHDQGQASLAELASRFGVSRGWAWKISAARRRSGQVERQRYRPGPSSQLNKKVLAELLTRHADWTLRELQVGLEKQTGVRFSTSYLWMVLKRMNFRLKKSHSTLLSVTPKPTKSGVASSSKKSARPRRNT
jgi:transposase